MVDDNEDGEDELLPLHCLGLRMAAFNWILSKPLGRSLQEAIQDLSTWKPQVQFDFINAKCLPIVRLGPHLVEGIICSKYRKSGSLD